jgi:hypothetical protein
VPASNTAVGHMIMENPKKHGKHKKHESALAAE